jgi:hypothetical protein
MHLGRPKGRAVTIAPKCQGLRKRRWFTTKFIDYMKNESAYSRAIFETEREIKDTHSLGAPTSEERHNNYTRLFHDQRPL